MHTASCRVHGSPYGYTHGQQQTAAMRSTRPAVCIAIWWTVHTAGCHMYQFIHQSATHANQTTTKLTLTLNRKTKLTLERGTNPTKP